jgi:zinc D-Ala-D-Ala carboxypeptidase
MIISEHLTLGELIRSDSAKRAGITNMPNAEQIENLKQLAEHIFEPIRNHFRVPIYISSGFRSVELCNIIKGAAKNSQHSRGEAIDIDMDGHSHDISNADIFNFIKANLKFDQLIWEHGTDKNPDWVHVSYTTKKPLRNQILKALDGGAYISI